jgi:hypothetical protein
VIWGGILLAILCWAFTFGRPEGNFWAKIGVSVLIVFSYSLIWQRPRISYRFRSLLLGLSSAILLYLIFFLGYLLSPYVLAGSKTQVGGIYALGKGTSRFLILSLLFFFTGPGEEIFWRGFLQSRLMEKLGDFRGYMAATAVYAGVHVFSWNLMLILAAFVAGAFWGALYMWKRDLLAQIVSHSFWNAAIFAVVPIR